MCILIIKGQSSWKLILSVEQGKRYLAEVCTTVLRTWYFFIQMRIRGSIVKYIHRSYNNK